MPLDESTKTANVAPIDILFNPMRNPDSRFTFDQILQNLRTTHTFKSLARTDAQVTPESFLAKFNEIFGYTTETIWTHTIIMSLQSVCKSLYFADMINWTERDIEDFITKRKSILEQERRES